MMLETFEIQAHIMHFLQIFSDTLSCCDHDVLPHHKGLLTDSERVSVKATEEN